MTCISFAPEAHTLIFGCRIAYKRGLCLDLALDTGASFTIISRRAAREIGYDLSQITEQVSFSDASTSHVVPLITLASMTLGTARLENIAALCYTISEELRIDGVIGLNFLRHFNMSLNFEEGILTLEKIKA